MTVAVSGDAPVEFPTTGRRRRGGGAAMELVAGCPPEAAVQLYVEWFGGGRWRKATMCKSHLNVVRS
ncbi:UNVERIFIED_CONTAM: hypothetical protein Sradi_5407700 [Sesamum radiatum]|uniref:Uncharacterized protein n=1 Tax=Sesamum radiatum TaxID=300843 RepID=A0AAW2ISF1_SESRA